MPMSTPDSFRDDLIRDINDALELIKTVNMIFSITSLSTNINKRQRDIIVEWAFVNLHAEWENFLESCFLSYMLGGQTASGYKPERYVFPDNEQHALRLATAGRDFFQWTKPDRVKDEACLCFKNGEPFRVVLESTSTDLAEMTVIRNAIVHKSISATEKFKTLVRNKLKTAPLDITPGIFLATVKPKTVRITFFTGYCNKLQVIAKKVVP